MQKLSINTFTLEFKHWILANFKPYLGDQVHINFVTYSTVIWNLSFVFGSNIVKVFLYPVAKTNYGGLLSNSGSIAVKEFSKRKKKTDFQTIVTNISKQTNDFQVDKGQVKSVKRLR